MRALVFAAGKGERMRPLTEHTPKPLLPVRGKPLIAWHLERLAAIGVRDVVVNTSWLADRFAPALGDGAHWGLRLHYRDGKPKYLADVPRFIHYLEEVLPRHAALQPLAGLLHARIKPALAQKAPA